MHEDLEALAAKLTKAQRRVLLSGRPPEGAGKWPVQNALIDKGLVAYFPWSLTPLGAQLRAHIMKEQG